MLEGGRLFYVQFNEFLLRCGILRERERRKLSAITWFVLASFLLALFASEKAAIAAWLYALFGDWMAAVVGTRWGKHRKGEKSLEGTTANLLACLFLALLVSPSLEFPLAVAIAGALVATVVELIPLPPDDNFTVPFLAGFVMHFLERIR
ncbi:MAG: hypothetical protein QN198_07540 [Armatimonadota bacterium]|nr:hypothetical protein [Armatimonadota bacterium]MDR5703441.1 hypothetical protein [Armatimonadota bacterium]